MPKEAKMCMRGIPMEKKKTKKSTAHKAQDKTTPKAAN